MSTTKEKILDAALALFNEQGESKVTMRTIAQALPMSLGNLTYHYKKRENLIEALYQRLVQHMDEALATIPNNALSLKLLYQMARIMMEHFYAYRFFMLDFAQLMREHPTIRQHYQQLTIARRAQFESLLDALVGTGWLQPPVFEEQYAYVYQRMQVYSDFWLSATAIQDEPLEAVLIDRHLAIVFAGWLPYLTERGQAAYWELFPRQ